jgi:methyl-accepting chemotaxis protein
MLKKLSVGTLLKSVIGILGVAVIVMLAQNVWTSWTQYQAATRSTTVIDISRSLFTALHNLRVDRSTTVRDLNGERQLTALAKQTQDVRAAEMGALQSALAVLAKFDFPNKESVLPGLAASVNKLTNLHEESARAIAQPKASRRAGLMEEFNAETSRLIDLLGKLSEQLTNLVKLDDSMIDQLLGIKQLAWLARNSAGDAQVMISNGLGGLKLPADPLLVYTRNLGKTESVWEALEDSAAGLNLPPQFAAALQIRSFPSCV